MYIVCVGLSKNVEFRIINLLTLVQHNINTVMVDPTKIYCIMA